MKKNKPQIAEVQDFCYRALDIISDGVYFIDSYKRLLFWNRGAEKISGYSRQDLEGNKRHSSFLKNLYFKKDKSRTACIKTKSGNRLIVEIDALKVSDRNNPFKGTLGVFRDITTYSNLKKAYKKINRLSQIDHLTSVLNKKAIEERVDAEIMRARRYKFPVSLAIADIDFFKKINDTYGHPAGDAVLRQISKILTSNLRSVDIVGRFGGDEFILIFPHINAREAMVPVERLRRLTESGKFKKIKNNVTISFGLTQLIDSDDSVSFIQRADDNLYKAKNTGRNKVASDGN